VGLSTFFFHFIELITEDGGDVFWGGLWDVYVDQEGTDSGRVVGVYACEVEVVDKLRYVVWRDRGKCQWALEVKSSRGMIDVHAVVV
jgi:hypothetical protein